MIQVIPVTNKRQLAAFIDFPHDLYRDDDNYVPELFIAQRDLLSPDKHPFHQHSSLQAFLGYRDGRVCGRIAAILNNNHNKFNNTNDGFFGFFDCADDEELAAALFREAEQWLLAKGVQNVIGPVNFSTNETCGMLVEGYDKPPVAMMPYNKAYYNELIGRLGFKKKIDLIAWQVAADDFKDKPLRLMNTLRDRLDQKGIKIRKVDLKNFKSEVDSLRDVYNKAWDRNLGFVPMTNEEFDYLAKDLKLILDPDFCMVAEHEGKIVGFSLCIPDINQILIKIRKGRLLPTGLFKLLFLKKKINGLRVIALGVLEPYRKMGIEAVFYGSIIQKGKEKNMRTAEASWILEDNFLMNKAIENINGKPYKKYRLYEKAI
jgi:GNAT superfamily N-acetyltransferase